MSDITDHYPVFIVILKLFPNRFHHHVQRLFRCHSAANIMYAFHSKVSNIECDLGLVSYRYKMKYIC